LEISLRLTITGIFDFFDILGTAETVLIKNEGKLISECDFALFSLRDASSESRKSAFKWSFRLYSLINRAISDL
jgi:hypothetical protein